MKKILNSQIEVAKILSEYILYQNYSLSIKNIFNVIMKTMNRNDRIKIYPKFKNGAEKCDRIFTADFGFLNIPFYDVFKNYEVRLGE